MIKNDFYKGKLHKYSENYKVLLNRTETTSKGLIFRFNCNDEIEEYSKDFKSLPDRTMATSKYALFKDRIIDRYYKSFQIKQKRFLKK